MKSCVYYDAILSVWSFLHKIIFDSEKWDTNSVVHRNISPLPHPIFHTFYEHMRTKKHALIPITHPIYMTFYKQLRTKKHVIIPLLVDCSCFLPEFDPLAWGALTVIAWWDLELGGGQTYLGVGALMTTRVVLGGGVLKMIRGWVMIVGVFKRNWQGVLGVDVLVYLIQLEEEIWE